MNGYKMVSHDLKKEIRENLPQKLLEHTENTMEKAVELAEKNNVDPEKARFAALVHDMFRHVDDKELNILINKYGIDERYRNNNALAHSKIAAEYLKSRYGIEDDDILNSVRFHTTGRPGMSLLEKIIFLADAIEKGRDYDGVNKIREEAEKGLDQGVAASLRETVNHLESLNCEIDQDTLDALDDTEGELKGESICWKVKK